MNISKGDSVYDSEIVSYTVLEILNTTAAETIAKEEVTERGHTIYEEKTVAELHPEYPPDDIVVRLKREDTGRELLWPVSRIQHNSSYG